MRIRTNTFQFLRLAALLAAGMCIHKAQAQPENGVDVSYFIESSIQTLRAPVRLLFSVENHSADRIKLKLGRDRKGSFSFVLQRPDGTKIQLPPLPMREGIFDLGMVSLSPGERLIHPLLLNEFARFETPGKYGIEVRLVTPIETGAATQVHVDPYYGKFEIVPRDEKMLMATAEKLTTQIESSRSVQEALGAATALAFIDDPVAVPYLERALHSGQYVEAPTIDALAKIGDAGATRVLIALLGESSRGSPDVNSPSGYRADLARRALLSVAATTSDQQVKKEIENALSH